MQDCYVNANQIEPSPFKQQLFTLLAKRHDHYANVSIQLNGVSWLSFQKANTFKGVTQTASCRATSFGNVKARRRVSSVSITDYFFFFYFFWGGDYSESELPKPTCSPEKRRQDPGRSAASVQEPLAPVWR